MQNSRTLHFPLAHLKVFLLLFVAMVFHLHMADQSPYPFLFLFVTTGCWLVSLFRSLLFSPSFLIPFFPLCKTPGCHYPGRCFRSSPLMTSQHKSATTPEVEFRIHYLKQSMHVISTSRPRQTNSGPVFFLFLSSPVLSLSLLFPNWYGIHGWSATVISIHLFFSQHITFAGTGSQTTGLLQGMESSFAAHRRPEETIDANLLMTLLWRLLKHQQRGRKRLLRGRGGGSCSIAPNLDLNSSAQQAVDATVLS